MSGGVNDCESLRQDVLARMRRIEGQVRGVAGMVEQGKPCAEILVQMRAVRSALRAANGVILRRALLDCSGALEDRDPEKLMLLLSDFVDY
ncbi:metal-sensitive transcriptional regulator [Desulfovibrio aminophilus]|jgi:DNA-binding FrmR family transcriptional regulator|uniref:metal-sensitive transcriptional regulator n=1 Tax=Desulfovibrio aminophilus TaxID=81425 RepID=UPI000408CD01|nr:metal-sensitive transcriptional regulator [Desulfovibrio aminophilus]